MKIIEKIALYLIALGIMYWGIINPKYPWLLFASFVVFGILIFLWVLLPMLKADNFSGRLKEVAYFENYRIPKLLLFTFLLVVGFWRIDILTYNHDLAILFMIVKIIVSLTVEIILFFRIFLDDTD